MCSCQLAKELKMNCRSEHLFCKVSKRLGYLARDVLHLSRREGQGTTMTTRGRQQLNFRRDPKHTWLNNSPDTK